MHLQCHTLPHIEKLCLCLRGNRTKSESITKHPLLMKILYNHRRTRSDVGLCCKHSALHRCMFCTRRNGTRSLTSPTRPSFCSEIAAFVKRKCIRAFMCSELSVVCLHATPRFMYNALRERRNSLVGCENGKSTNPSFGFSLT